MKLEFIGAAGIVTGSCHKISVNGKSYLLDCGMYQGKREVTRRNYLPFSFNPKKISAVILSHAHIDHSGLIPKLYKEGFRGPVYCTKATKDLCRIMLEDSADIHEREAAYDNKRLEAEGLPLRKPLYEKKDARACISLFRAVDYNSKFAVSPEIAVVFRDAGHILGSAIVEVFAAEKGAARKIVYSGDLGKPDTPIIKNPSFIREADYVLLESTYGGRVHEKVRERKKMLLSIIKANYENRGRLMVPSFAIERTQEIIYTLNEFTEKGLVPSESVFVDSPLATKATEIFTRHPECYDREFKELVAKGDNPFEFPRLRYIQKVSESKKLNRIKEPCIIIAGSGMCNGGRIKHHLRNHVGERNSTVLFVGYQAKGTLGRKIRDGYKKIKIYGKWYDVKVNLESIGGFSAHADRTMLVKWAKNFKNSPKIYLVHGEPEEAKSLAGEIRKFNRNVSIARMHQAVNLA